MFARSGDGNRRPDVCVDDDEVRHLVPSASTVARVRRRAVDNKHQNRNIDAWIGVVRLLTEPELVARDPRPVDGEHRFVVGLAWIRRGLGDGQEAAIEARFVVRNVLKAPGRLAAALPYWISTGRDDR